MVRLALHETARSSRGQPCLDLHRHFEWLLGVGNGSRIETGPGTWQHRVQVVLLARRNYSDGHPRGAAAVARALTDEVPASLTVCRDTSGSFRLRPSCLLLGVLEQEFISWPVAAVRLWPCSLGVFPPAGSPRLSRALVFAESNWPGIGPPFGFPR